MRTTARKPLISIHAPREGSDLDETLMQKVQAKISIHAPREGSDAGALKSPARPFYFYPRSPRGERLHGLRKRPLPGLFLSTLPARGATKDKKVFTNTAKFLSTLPARGATYVGVRAETA